MTKSRQQQDGVASAFVSLEEAVEVVTSEVLSPPIAEQRLKDLLERGQLASKAEDIVVWKHRWSEPDGGVSLYYGLKKLHLGAGWVPPQAWKNADVRWAESSFTSAGYDRNEAWKTLMSPPSGYWSDRYEVRGVRVSVAQLKQLFPLAYKYNHIPDNTVKRPPGRPPGSGFHKQDAPIVKKMHESIVAGSCSNPTDAVRLIRKEKLFEIPGNSDDAGDKRLVRRYGKTFTNPRVK